jgi:NO-binding membrane sensor protein with MHYT domain
MWQIIVSALVMGIAVCGMHYTGMAAADFIPNPALPNVASMATTTFSFAAIITAIDIATLLVALVVALAESNKRILIK